ncbi:MAG: type IVB secretion system protein IcmH/DotU [Methylococcaceae bacterium]|nr:type IVB secretion system protein IcmH/DotU [Methylococcaceae bacterium]
MSDNDFFDQQNSSTVLKPRPGSRQPGRRPGRVENPPPTPQSPPPQRVVRRPIPTPPPSDDFSQTISEGRKNILVSIATPLVTLASSLRNSVSHADVDSLRERLVQSLNDFSNDLLHSGYMQETVADSSYALCTLMDEVVLNTPWGGHSSWGTQTLLSHFHGEAWGGENFFSKLNTLKTQPAVNLDILELYYLCLSLGLQGRFRVLDNGLARLNEVREDLYQLIRRQKGGYEKALSAHWQGIRNLKKTLLNYTPWWVATAVAAGILLVMYLVFLYLINASADPQFIKLDNVARGENPMHNEHITMVVYTPEYVEPLAEIQLEKRKLSLKELLAPEIKQGLVDVSDKDGNVVIRTRGLFVSGSDKVMPEMLPLIDRIAEELNDMEGKILVSGHSDNVPMFSVRFPSNWELSKARAEQVMQRLEDGIDNDDVRFVSEGRADREPVVDNKTAANRALNRRVEIIVTERI